MIVYRTRQSLAQSDVEGDDAGERNRFSRRRRRLATAGETEEEWVLSAGARLSFIRAGPIRDEQAAEENERLLRERLANARLPYLR